VFDVGGFKMSAGGVYLAIVGKALKAASTEAQASVWWFERKR